MPKLERGIAAYQEVDKAKPARSKNIDKVSIGQGGKKESTATYFPPLQPKQPLTKAEKKLPAGRTPASVGEAEVKNELGSSSAEGEINLTITQIKRAIWRVVHPDKSDLERTSELGGRIEEALQEAENGHPEKLKLIYRRLVLGEKK